MYRHNGSHILRLHDSAIIPLDPLNIDYVSALAWVAEGNAFELPSEPDRRAALVQGATQKRWEIETGGITLPGGIAVKTDTSDQLRIGSTIEGMKANGYMSVPFKAASGWIDLTLAQIEALRSAVAEHVRQCFIAERAHHAAIELLADADLGTYDINTGWPAAAIEPTGALNELT